MNNIEALAKISFKPIKKPCKNIRMNKDEPGFTYFDYDQTSISEPIKTNDMSYFCDDTFNLLKLLSIELNPSQISTDSKFLEDSRFSNFPIPGYRVPGSEKMVFDAVSAYMAKWGELIPKTNNRISDRELFDISNWYSCVKTFWDLNEDSLANKFIDQFLMLSGSMNRLPVDETKPKKANESFTQIIVRNFDSDQVSISMLWDKRKISSAYSDFWVIIKEQTPEELKQINFSKQNKINWIRGIMLKSVTNYLSKNPITFTTSLRDSEMHFSGTTENLFLAFVMNDLLQTNKRKIVFCECGCGRPVPVNRKSYFSEKCRENMPARKIAHWLKARKKRGQLSEDKYNELMEPVVDELLDGKSEKEIRERINSELKKEGKQLPSQRSSSNKV